MPGRRPSGHDERGLTLVELMMVMAIMSIVMAAAGAGLISLSETAKSTQDRTESISELRQGMERLIRDLRAANPVDVQTPVSDYDNEVSFAVFCSDPGVGSCQADGLRHMTYRVQANQLEIDTNGVTAVNIKPEATSLPPQESRFAIVNTAAEPVFTYFDRDGTQIETTGATAAPPTTFRDCTKTVRVHLRMVAESGDLDNPISLVTRVALRNFNEVSGC